MPDQPPDKRIITTQSLLAIENASEAMAKHESETGEVDEKSLSGLMGSTEKLRAHYAAERGLQPPDVTLDLLRKRHAEGLAKRQADAKK